MRRYTTGSRESDDGIVDVSDAFAVDSDFFSPSPDAEESHREAAQPVGELVEARVGPENAERREIPSRRAMEDLEPERPSRSSASVSGLEPRVSPAGSAVRHEPLPEEPGPSRRDVVVAWMDRVPRSVSIALGVVGVLLVLAVTNLPSHAARAVGIGGGAPQTWTQPANASSSKGAARELKPMKPVRLVAPKVVRSSSTVRRVVGHRAKRTRRRARKAPRVSRAVARPAVPVYRAPAPAPRVDVRPYRAPATSAAAKEFGL